MKDKERKTRRHKGRGIRDEGTDKERIRDRGKRKGIQNRERE